jgi:hypothetical protein
MTPQTREASRVFGGRCQVGTGIISMRFLATRGRVIQSSGARMSDRPDRQRRLGKKSRQLSLPADRNRPNKPNRSHRFPTENSCHERPTRFSSETALMPVTNRSQTKGDTSTTLSTHFGVETRYFWGGLGVNRGAQRRCMRRRASTRLASHFHFTKVARQGTFSSFRALFRGLICRS